MTLLLQIGIQCLKEKSAEDSVSPVPSSTFLAMAFRFLARTQLAFKLAFRPKACAESSRPLNGSEAPRLPRVYPVFSGERRFTGLTGKGGIQRKGGACA